MEAGWCKERLSNIYESSNTNGEKVSVLSETIVCLSLPFSDLLLTPSARCLLPRLWSLGLLAGVPLFLPGEGRAIVSFQEETQNNSDKDTAAGFVVAVTELAGFLFSSWVSFIFLPEMWDCLCILT